MILLSIVIPVYQRQNGLNALKKQLIQAVDSSSFQNYIEIIVVDDGSTEKIRLSNFPPYIYLLHNKYNLGAPLARKLAYLKTKGKFIHFHDSDDSISDTWLAEVIQQLQKQTDLDILMTGRVDQEKSSKVVKIQKYFHKHSNNIEKITKRLVYRNCMGPLGGITFSRRVLEEVKFKKLASCQDWQMYLDVVAHAKVLVSRPDIKFIFNKTGDDRISHNPRKKILGHLQLARITGKKSPFGRNIRLFYLYTCKQHIFNKGGQVLKFYKKNRLSIILSFLVISVYWRMT